MKKLLLASAVLLTYAPYQVMAADINAEGAEHLKQVFTQILNDQKEINEAAGGGIDYVYTGEVKVEPKESYYTITLPQIEIKMRDTFSESFPDASEDPAAEGTEETAEQTPSEDIFSVDLGITAINAVPADKENYWKMSVALPATITMQAAGEMAVNMNIGQQNTAGLFNDKWGYFTKLDATYQDVVFNVTNYGETSQFKVGEIKATADYEENAEQLLSGDAVVSLKNFLIQDEQNEVDVKIGDVSVKAGMKNFKPLTMDEYKEKSLAMVDKMNAMNEQAMSAGEFDFLALQEMLNAAFEMSQFEGMDIVYTVKDINMTSTNPDADMKSFNLGSAFMGFGLDNLATNEGEFGMKFGYADVAMDPVKPGYDGIIPQGLNINVKATKLPMPAMWELGMNTAKGVAENPDMAQMAGMGLLMKLPMMLSQAGSQVVIENNYLKGDDYNIALNGNATADMNAIYSAVAEFKGQFSGLDELLAKVQANANNPELTTGFEFMSMAQQLEMMKSFGKAETGANGKSLYTYDIKVTADGQLLLNGQDMSAMTGGPAAGGQPMQQQQTAP